MANLEYRTTVEGSDETEYIHPQSLCMSKWNYHQTL
jgi:hypothetical protein